MTARGQAEWAVCRGAACASERLSFEIIPGYRLRVWQCGGRCGLRVEFLDSEVRAFGDSHNPGRPDPASETYWHLMVYKIQDCEFRSTSLIRVAQTAQIEQKVAIR